MMRTVLFLLFMLIIPAVNAQEVDLKAGSIATAGVISNQGPLTSDINITKWRIGEVYLLTLPGNELSAMEKEPGLSVYPNPFRDDLRLQVRSNKLETCTIQISDLSGKICKQFDAKQFHPNQDVVLDLAELNSGMYLLSVSSEDKSKKWMVKLVKN